MACAEANTISPVTSAGKTTKKMTTRPSVAAALLSARTIAAQTIPGRARGRSGERPRAHSPAAGHEALKPASVAADHRRVENIAKPDHETVANAVEDIRSASEGRKDALLHELLCLAYPSRASQDG
jgi:hypothetical protein